jgi:hypothetical protein
MAATQRTLTVSDIEQLSMMLAEAREYLDPLSDALSVAVDTLVRDDRPDDRYVEIDADLQTLIRQSHAATIDLYNELRDTVAELGR